MSMSSASTAAPARRAAWMLSRRWAARAPRSCPTPARRSAPPPRRVAGAPGRILPTPGLPQRREGQFVYAADPDYLAAMTPLFVAAGAAIIGGCCGTTPAHIRAMRTALDAIALDAIAPDARPAE